MDAGRVGENGRAEIAEAPGIGVLLERTATAQQQRRFRLEFRLKAVGLLIILYAA